MKRLFLVGLFVIGILLVFTGLVLQAQDEREQVVQGVFATLPDRQST